MKKITLSGMLAMLLFSCTKSDVQDLVQTQNVKPVVTTAAEQSSRVDEGCEPTTTTVALLAGQTMNSGTVTVTNDGVNLSVTYTTINGWTISEVHLYVGELANAPQNNGGNPVPGRFPFKQVFNTGVISYTKTIPLSALPECFVVAAHAVVKNNTAGGAGTQTGWGQGTQFPGNNWGMYFDYCTTTCP